MADVVLFDFFGTLVQYEADRTALRYPRSHGLLQSWGHPLSHDEFIATWDDASATIEARVGPSHNEVKMVDYALAFDDLGGTSLTFEQCDELAAEFVAEWAQHVRPIDGAAELLASLSARFRLGIVSNTNDPDMVPRMVDEFFDADLFEAITLSVDHGRRKPHPSIYAAALGEFAGEASKAIFVGDSYEADYLGPIAVGMSAFLIAPRPVSAVPESRRLSSVLDLLPLIAG